MIIFEISLIGRVRSVIIRKLLNFFHIRAKSITAIAFIDKITCSGRVLNQYFKSHQDF